MVDIKVRTQLNFHPSDLMLSDVKKVLTVVLDLHGGISIAPKTKADSAKSNREKR